MLSCAKKAVNNLPLAGNFKLYQKIKLGIS